MGIIYTEPEYNEKNGYWCFKQSTGTNPGAIGVSCNAMDANYYEIKSDLKKLGCPYFSTWA